jgi:GT2 family glycosyltransferase
MKDKAYTNYKVGIVILTYNCIEFTRKCLSSLRDVTYPNFQIVVIDNASWDGSAVLIPEEFPEVIFMPQSENLGFSGGNNIGISWCLKREFDAILLLNNDTIVTPEFLTWMVKQLNTNIMVTPRILSLREPELFGACMGDFDMKRGVWSDNLYRRSASSVCKMPQKVNMASACCLLAHCDTFNKIGLFDNNYFLYYEDADLITRAKLAGSELLYEPRAIIYHGERVSTGENTLSPLALYYSLRNRLYFMNKFKHNNMFHLCFLSYFILSRLVLSVYWLITGNSVYCKSTYRGLVDYLMNRMGNYSSK